MSKLQETRETVYEHIGGSDTVTITAAERWSITMIRNLEKRCPEQVEIVCENADGSLLARIPFDWMRIVPKKKTKTPNA